jgi:hypothetical protein
MPTMTVRGFLREVGRHVRHFSTNWAEYDAPVSTKLALAARNRARATFSRRQCCGNLGQPGC